MTIAIIVAMTKELNLLLPLMQGHRLEQMGHLKVHTGSIGPHRIVAMECGIGKVNAAIGAATLIDACSPGLLINTGVAAGAGQEVAVLDTVIATGVVHHDFWCLGEQWGQVPGCPLTFPTLTAGAQLPAGPGIKRGLIASGDMFITTAAQVAAIKEHFPTALAIDMESAAIAQACWSRGVPYVCMRVISDTPWCHHDNSSQYEDFWEAAPRQSFALVKTLIENL